MKSRLIYVLLIFIICFSISCVSAADLNETQQMQFEDNQTLDLSDGDVLAVEDNFTEDILQNYNDESVLNMSDDDNVILEEYKDIILEDGNDELNSPDLDLGEALRSKNPLYGIVDFGSNTIKLKIYELKKSGKTKSLFSMSEISVTAVYCENNNLTQKGIDELISILDDYNDIMDLVNVKTKYIFATASLRKIGNSDEVIAAVKDELGLEIHLLSGEKEAITSFNAVRDTELTEDNGIVIDLGGGSCEVIDFVNKTPVTMESMPIGSFSCYNEYVSTMFPNETEIVEIQNRVLTELKKLTVSNSTQRYDLFGIGGSIRAIKDMLVYLEYIDEDTQCIPVSMLDDLLDEFSENTKENYQKILNVNADRVNTFVPGIIITKTVAQYFNITQLHICKNCIREGILNEILENESREKAPDNGTFKELQSKIANASSGATIYLYNNYTYDDTFSKNGINITQPITIEGNGFTIDGLNKARIFNIYAQNNVILNNIRFVNGYSDYGGAIKFNDEISYSQITNCIFENNTATDYGGAIHYNDNYFYNVISNSNFTNNTSPIGGSIYIKSECDNNNFTQLNFINNRGEYGVGIYIMGELYNDRFYEINFINNKATDSGGAIFFRNAIESSTLSKIKLINNSAKNGGAISLNGDVEGNTFTQIICVNNSASFNGGAFFFTLPTQNNVFDNITFVNNTAANKAGVLYSHLKFINNELTNLNFENNKAGSEGGVFYIMSDFGGNVLSYCNFTNNNAVNGSVFYHNSGSLSNTLSNLSFTNNVANDTGLIYYNSKMEDTITDSKFISNNANNSAVLYLNSIGYIIIDNCEFTDNTAGNVSCICFFNGSEGTIQNSVFEGKNTIYIANSSYVIFVDNIEKPPYPNSYFILNEGTLKLYNNSLRNPVINRGSILSKTSVHVLNNETIPVTYTHVYLFAYCVDDNGNYIVGDNITFDINGYKLTVAMGYDCIEYVYYDLTENGTFLINASLSGHLSDCTYYTGIIIHPPQMNVSNVEVTPDENAEVSVTLPRYATGLVTVQIENHTYASSIKNGTALIIIPKLESGNYTANVTYSGDDIYLPESKKINIYVKTVLIYAYDMVRGWNSNYDYQVKLMDDKGNAIKNKLISFTIAGKQYFAMTNANGFANINPGLKVGTYEISISSPLLKQSITKNLKIAKRIQNNKDIKAYYSSNQKYKVKIIGDDGKAETKGKTVSVTIDNKKQTLKTDKGGFIAITLNKNIKPGKHTLKIQYKGFSVQNKITVMHTLSSKKLVKVKKSAKKIVLKAKLKSNNKKAIKNKQIKFKIKGKTYKAKTNKKGIAKIAIKNKFKKGKYPVRITYLKDIIKTNIKIK